MRELGRRLGVAPNAVQRWVDKLRAIGLVAGPSGDGIVLAARKAKANRTVEPHPAPPRAPILKPILKPNGKL